MTAHPYPRCPKEKDMRRLRRRKYLVDGSLQLRLIGLSAGYVAFYVFVMAAATFVPLIYEMRSLNPNSNQAYLLANSFIYLHRHVWPITLLVLAAVILHSLVISHRVAGPLYRFRRIFSELAAGKVPGQQRLRRGDYLQHEMKLINEMLHNLQSRASHLQEIQMAIANSISGIARKTHDLSDQELTLLAEDLDAQGKRLAEQILLSDRES